MELPIYYVEKKHFITSFCCLGKHGVAVVDDANDVVVNSLSSSQMTTPRHTFRHLLRYTLSHFVTLSIGSIVLSKWCHFFPDITSDVPISFW